jgi:hypothetical protein
MTRVSGRDWYSGLHGIGPIFRFDKIAQLVRQGRDSGTPAFCRTDLNGVLARFEMQPPLDCLGYGFVMLRSS